MFHSNLIAFQARCSVQVNYPTQTTIPHLATVHRCYAHLDTMARIPINRIRHTRLVVSTMNRAHRSAVADVIHGANVTPLSMPIFQSITANCPATRARAYRAARERKMTHQPRAQRHYSKQLEMEPALKLHHPLRRTHPSPIDLVHLDSKIHRTAVSHRRSAVRPVVQLENRKETIIAMQRDIRSVQIRRNYSFRRWPGCAEITETLEMFRIRMIANKNCLANERTQR